jgi:hypothetical protein
VPPIRVWVLRDQRPLIAYNFDYYGADGLQEAVAFAIADLGGELPVARDVEPIGRARLLLLD